MKSKNSNEFRNILQPRHVKAYRKSAVIDCTGLKSFPTANEETFKRASKVKIVSKPTK